MPMSGYTLREAAAMSGVKLSAVRKAIASRQLPARRDRKTHRRRLDETALLALALVRSLPAKLRLSHGDAWRLLKTALAAGDVSTVSIGNLVHIDAGKALSGVRRRIALYEHAREWIVNDPDIMGGAATIRGTRITAEAILGRIAAGDTVESIVEDYPYLDLDTVECAAIYASANPSRGRPAGKTWRHASRSTRICRRCWHRTCASCMGSMPCMSMKWA